jgi:hypothetical protein
LYARKVWRACVKILHREEKPAPTLKIVRESINVKPENESVRLSLRWGGAMSISELYEYFKARDELWKFFRMFPPHLG